MKKNFHAFGIALAGICGTLAFASSVQGDLSLPEARSRAAEELPAASGKHANKAFAGPAKIDSRKITEISADLIKRSEPTLRLRTPQTARSASTTDLWNSAEWICAIINEEYASYDVSTGSITITNANSPSEEVTVAFTGVIDEDYAWIAGSGHTYTFSGTLTANGSCQVSPDWFYVQTSNDQVFVDYGSGITLDETNNYTSEFSITTKSAMTDHAILVGFTIESSEEQVEVLATDISLTSQFNCVNAESWSEETGPSGLGLDGLSSYSTFAATLDDGITTIGLYRSGSYFYLTGINTTAEEVTIPAYAIADDQPLPINYIGRSGMLEMSEASSMKSLRITGTPYLTANFGSCSLTDIYLEDNCSTNSYFYGNPDIVLHIPYTSQRRNFTSYNFKRVLVGDEQLSYPETTISNWVIAGENEGDYFGISTYDNVYTIAEIFTENDSIALPVATPAGNAGDYYYIRGLGSEKNQSHGTLCANAPGLRTISVPSSYTKAWLSWDNNPIRTLYMNGAAPETYKSVPANITVYVMNRSDFDSYESNNSWKNSNILPYGWEFDWMTVNVTRKGEFAQTYIEMTDADWTLGIHVKITGKLNTTDLNNIKKLTELKKLDLSEAEFTELPNSFLYGSSTASKLIEVTLPENITTIPEQAFGYSSKLVTVTAPGLTRVDRSAFTDCSALKNLDISNVTAIGNYAFNNCSSYDPTECFPANLKSLGSDAFSSTRISRVALPEGITKLESSVFYNCTALSEIALPSSLRSIGSNAFNSCTSLSHIEIPEGVTQIDGGLFSGCSNLDSVSLPSTLNNVGSYIFSNCSKLVSIRCKAIVPPSADGSITSGINRNKCVLYIAPFTIDAYREASYWSEFFIMKPLDEPVKNIYINRPMSFDLLSEDNAVLKDNPNMTLDYSISNYYRYNVGQLSASGDGTLSAGVFLILHNFRTRNYSDTRTTLVNNAENMRADSVVCSIDFDKNTWHFVSFQYDVEMADIFSPNSTDFVIRGYNSASRASGESNSNWEDIPADGVLKAGKGYIIQAANNASSNNSAIVRFPSRNTVSKNRLFTSDNVIVELEEHASEFAHNRSWNLVGNPYPCYYDMNFLMDEFSAPITLWTGSSYRAYSPVDDNIILRPNEAFFVQRPLNKAEMIFGAEGRLHYDEAIESNNNQWQAPAMPSSAAARSVFNFNVEGCGSSDRARIVINEDALAEYEAGRDAAKFFADASTGVEAYIGGPVRYDICERPLAEGRASLGMRLAAKGTYTISLNGRNIAGWSVVLTDNATGAVTDLTSSDYSFEAEQGTIDGRFSISFLAPETTSDASIEAAAGPDAMVKAVNAAGVVVFSGRYADFIKQATTGVYLVVEGDKVTKVVIK